MTTKKARAEEQEEEPIGAAEPTPEPEAPDLPYTMGDWCGLPLWQCRYCLFATADGEYVFYQHLTRHLGAGDTDQSPASNLVDPSGNPL